MKNQVEIAKHFIENIKIRKKVIETKQNEKVN